MVGDEAFTSDLTQETFVRAFQRLVQFRGQAAFSSWLHRIAVSVALRGIEANKQRFSDQLIDERVAGPPSPSPEPDLRPRLQRAIDELPDDYRVVFLMHDLEGYTHAEIARVQEVAVGTSKARLSRARAQLRELLGDAIREYVR